jgi:hypothetical protein
VFHHVQDLTPSITSWPHNKLFREAVDCLDYSLANFHNCASTNQQVLQESSNWGPVTVWAQPFQSQR